MPPIRVAVIGAGAFGRNHLRVYRELQSAPNPGNTDPGTPNPGTPNPGAPSSPAASSPVRVGLPHTHADPSVQLAAIVDPSEPTRAEAAARYNIPAFASVEDLLAANLDIHAASVCVPTIHHAAVAEHLLRNNIDVLIEKPFAATLTEADEILTLAQAKQRIVQIGHLERFNPAVTAVIPLLNRPMFFEAHRLSIFTPRSLDVDVVLDLMIHDLDIVLQLAASPVRELRAVGLPVLSRKVDIANVRVEFDSGCIANFTASRVSTEQVRKLRFFQPRQYLSLDFARQELLTIDVAAGASPQTVIAVEAPDSSSVSSSLDAEGSLLLSSRPEREARSGETRSSGGAAGFSPAPPPIPHPSAGLSLQKFAVEKSEPLRLEIEEFLDAVRTRRPPRVTGEQGRAALALALEINAAIAAHAQRAGL